MSKRCAIEPIEARRLYSVVQVTNVNDSGDGSLRAAIAMAANGDTLDLRSLNGTIKLLNGQFSISKSLLLMGPGDKYLTIDADNKSRVFNVDSNATLSVSGMTLTNGNSDTAGGAILNRGVLNLKKVTVTASTSFIFGGGIYNSGASVDLDHCSIVANTVQGDLNASGGGLYSNNGTITANGCTFNNNVVTGLGMTGLKSG